MTATTDLTALEIGGLVAGGEATAREMAELFLERADATEPSVGAYLHLDAEHVLATADAVDSRKRQGESLSPLAGVPVAVKDNICTADAPTTCASRFLESYRPPHDATVVSRTRRAGAVPFGKTNMDEFGMGSSTEHSALGRTTNPWNAERVPGGSSGGSAATVAARSAPLALGSDTGGSVRQPAAFCGVVGLKPTQGCLSRWGLVAFGSSLEQVGVLGRRVDDVMALFEELSGSDPLDGTSVEPPAREASDDSGVLRFGVPPEATGTGVSSDVRRSFEAALGVLESTGAERVDVELPRAEAAVATYYVVSSAEASANLSRFDGIRFGRAAEGAKTVDDLVRRSRTEGFGPEVQRRILMGTHVLCSGYCDRYYRHASRVRTMIRRDFDAAFERCDVVVMPTAPTTAFSFGEKVDDPLAMYLSDVFTVTANLAGLPGLSLPCGVGDDGLPVGLQLLAPRWREDVLAHVGSRLEGELRFEESHVASC